MGTGTERRSSDLLSDREFFIQETFGQERCEACNALPVCTSATIYLPESEVKKRDPDGFWLGRYGSAIRIPKTMSSERYYTFTSHRACAACEKEMERMIHTQYPSYGFVEFTRAPRDRLILRAG